MRKNLPPELIEKVQVFKRVFAGKDGERALEILANELNPDNIFVDGDAHKTSYNLGKRDAFIYINQLLRIDKDD